MPTTAEALFLACVVLLAMGADEAACWVRTALLEEPNHGAHFAQPPAWAHASIFMKGLRNAIACRHAHRGTTARRSATCCAMSRT